MFVSKTKFLLVLLIACIFFNSAVLAADEEKTDGIAVVWAMDVEKGKSGDFKKAIKGFHDLYSKKDGHFEWHWYEVATGPDTGQYLARSGNHNWADLDAMENIWDEELGKYWSENVSPLIANAERYINAADDDVYHWTEGKTYKFFRIRNFQVKQGMDFGKHIKKIHETLQKGGWGNDYALSWDVSGGYGNGGAFVFPAESWADMAETSPKFKEVMLKNMKEKDFDELMKNYSASYKTTTTRLVRSLPELTTK